MIIGEAPGAKEDVLGEPFVGRSGKVLNDLLKNVGINPYKEVFICNVVKCRPPKNRRPSRTELFNRLLNREGADKSIAQERMKQFDKDLLHWKEYDYVIINDNLEKCYKEIMNYINFRLDGKNNLEFNKKFIEDHIKKLIN